MSKKGAKVNGVRRSTTPNGSANGYDPDLINAEALAVCDHYLGGRRREGRRYVYTCPECAKPDFEVEPVRGMAGCFNPSCPMPRTTNALGVISHLEDLERRGAEFIRCMEKGYEILGLAVQSSGPLSGSDDDGSAPREEAHAPDGRDPSGRGWETTGVALPRGRRWVRPNGVAPEEPPGRPAPPGERVYPIEAYLEGPDGERIPAEAVIVEEGDSGIKASPEQDKDPAEPAENLSPDVDPPDHKADQAPPRARVMCMPGLGPEAATPDERLLRHAVYERLLALCPLEERDARFFEERGLDPRTVEEGCFGSTSVTRSRWAVERLFETFGGDLLRVPGFYRPEGQPGRVRFSLYGDYALIPYYDVGGYITTVEGRLIGEPKNPRDKKYKALLGSGVHLYVHPRFTPGEVVAFCEGAIGAMVAARYGIPVAAIKGFRNYKISAREIGAEDRALPELEGVDFDGREIVYIPDVDVKPASREEVMGAVPAACEWLVARQGGVPKVALLPEDAKDLDQWLLSLPESKRSSEAHGLLSEAVDLAEWSASLEDCRHHQCGAYQDLSAVSRSATEQAPGKAAGSATRRAGASTGGKRDLLDDDDDAPKTSDQGSAGASETKSQAAGDAPTRGRRWGTDRARPDRGDATDAPDGAERDRKGPMHPAMARWYEVAGYTEEQVAGARRQTAMRRIAGKRGPPERDTPVSLPRWTPGEVLLAIAATLAMAAALCFAAYATRAQAGAVGIVGSLITWPSWWLETALYAWAGALAANWMVGSRHRAKRRQLEAHLRGEE